MQNGKGNTRLVWNKIRYITVSMTASSISTHEPVITSGQGSSVSAVPCRKWPTGKASRNWWRLLWGYSVDDNTCGKHIIALLVVVNDTSRLPLCSCSAKTKRGDTKTEFRTVCRRGGAANTRWSTNVGLMLAHRLRRRPNINPTLARYLAFAGMSSAFYRDDSFQTES